MTEAGAQEWLQTTFGATAIERLEEFVRLLLAEAARQSLIARSTFDAIWSRHVADSARFVALAPQHGHWIDVGSGGGLPGIVIAILRNEAITLVEPRRKRADFLATACEALSLNQVSVVQSNVQNLSSEANVVSARAVASIPTLLDWTRGVVSRETVFLLPRGENAVSDMEFARRTWHGAFHVEQSLTDQKAGIVVAKDVQPR